MLAIEFDGDGNIVIQPSGEPGEEGTFKTEGDDVLYVYVVPVAKLPEGWTPERVEELRLKIVDTIVRAVNGWDLT